MKEEYVKEICPHCGYKTFINKNVCMSCGYGWQKPILPKNAAQQHKAPGCPSCRTGLCPDDNGGFVKCTICGNMVQTKSAK